MFSTSHKPVMLTGARRDGVIGVRQQSDLEIPVPGAFRPCPPVVADDILLAAQFGQKLDAMLPKTVPGGLWRFFRTLHIYVKPRAIDEPLDRIHQYCRCIEGQVLPAIGKTKQQFKSRTELFIGPGHHDLMGALYDIRSHVEHLHENRYLEPFDRDVRLDLVKKEAIVEYIARMALARIISQDALWPHFGNTAALEKFWALSPDERRKNWGVTNLSRPTERVVAFYNQRGTAEQWIKEGKTPSSGHDCHVADSATTRFGFNFTPWRTISPTSCGRWHCPRR